MSSRTFFLQWPATALAVVLLVPFWWLLPGLWLGWRLGGAVGRHGGDRWLAALPTALALPCLVLPLARLANLPWKEIWLALAAVTLAAALRHVRRAARSGGRLLAPWPGMVLAAAALAVIYAWPMRGLAAPPGIDMSMHLTFARLLWQQTAVPVTQAPIFPGVPLGAYPLGFHALTALTALVTGNVLTAGLLVTALTHAFVPVALYLCCRRRDDGPDWPTAAAALLIAWIARNPQAYVSWGGNPCVLGTMLALVAARRLLVPETGPRGVPAIEAGLLAAAVALVHPTPAAMLAYVAAIGLPVLAWLGVARLDRARMRHLALAGLVAVAILLPQLPAIRSTHMAPHEVAWVRENHRLPPQAPQPGLSGAVRFLNGQYGDTMVILFAVLVLANVARGRAGRDRDRRLPVIHVAAVLAVFALASLAARWWLPPALALYPERMMLFALPVFVLALRDAGAGWRPGRRGGKAIAATVVVLALAILAGAKHRDFYARKVQDDVFVTAGDARAFAWLTRHAAPGTVVDNNYGDAGVFIPAATGLAVTRPQTNPIWFDEMAAFQAQGRAQLRFLGARRIASDDSTASLIAPADVVHTERENGRTTTIARVAP